MTVLAYLGPETMLPMTSVIAGIVGFLDDVWPESLGIGIPSFSRETGGGRAENPGQGPSAD